MKTLYFYNLLKTSEVQKILEEFQADFNEILNEEFTQEEIEKYEDYLDELAHIYVQPLFSEMSFDDFEVDENKKTHFQFIFESCKSCVVMENVADYYQNPFQVSYITELLRLFDVGLIDRGGFLPLIDKKDYHLELKNFKGMFALKNPPKLQVRKQSIEVGPVERNLQMVKDLARTEHLDLAWNDKAQKLLLVILEHPSDIYLVSKMSDLSPKDFDDYLEKWRNLLKNKQ